MGKWVLKGCPRCHGDLSISETEFGGFQSCLQCGYANYGDPSARTEAPKAAAKIVPSTVGA